MIRYQALRALRKHLLFQLETFSLCITKKFANYKKL